MLLLQMAFLCAVAVGATVGEGKLANLELGVVRYDIRSQDTWSRSVKHMALDPQRREQRTDHTLI